ncbi:uncharacterized protein LOC6579828 isoform X1 [Drosophila mojavensis]|uniref:Uncharacterized protein n=1 Tax=Drosophila mojavensis TaxID=7230 RepID=B4KTQ3_DROMO|nr:uncharacterized protein LOC6579828 isoform X1 [Drosophila mojavensis]EDW09636.2 uncharacterized protein Dmoj_GI20613 [Drosophila mojavensis]
MQTKDISRDDIINYRNVKPAELNNNHHVVPIGIIIVLCTVYLMIAGVQNNYNYYLKPGVAAVKLNQQNANDQLHHLLANGKEEQPVCREVEVFNKEEFTLKEVKQSKRQQLVNIKRHKQQIKSIKSTGRQSKSELQRKKDKKPNTAEPIIYLFALVFIYLLLKAASDINQHYKTQSKGDKRLRRCSLQSYAQKEQRHNHQDRRASKDVLPLQTRHNIFIEGRSISLDRYKAKEQTARDLVKRTYPSKPIHPAIGKHLPGDVHLEPRMSRRLSVPVSINYQMVQVSPLVNPELVRRGSMAEMILPATAPSVQTPDSKRRVRMINRH